MKDICICGKPNFGESVNLMKKIVRKQSRRPIPHNQYVFFDADVAKAAKVSLNKVRVARYRKAFDDKDLRSLAVWIARQLGYRKVVD